MAAQPPDARNAAPAHDRHPELPRDSDAMGVPPPHRRLPLVLVVAVGGAIGAPLRYALARVLPTAPQGWPTATFVTNLLGAFLLGVLLEGLARLGPDTGARRVVRLGVGTGILGAFTTYSTLATEAVLLGRAGRPGLAVVYGLVSAVAGYGAAAAGIGLAAVGHRAVRSRAGGVDRDVRMSR
jgi:CrcB protein